MQFDNGWDALLDPGKATDFFALSHRPQFDPDLSEWDLGQAWWLAELSRTIYRRDGRAEYLRRVGLREHRFFEEGSTRCAIVRPLGGRDFAVLVFRGTDQLRNWLTNLRAIPADWPSGGKVHRGFRRALRKVWDEVRQGLEAIDAPCFYTGHSLGGALATLAASARPPVAAYTFGAPRVGDREFVASLRSPLYRVVNHRDVVTTVPPPVEALGFVHGGGLRYIASDRRLLVDPLEEEVAANRSAGDRLLNDLADRRRWYHPHEMLSDHAPVNYVAHLVALLRQDLI
ncbi:MAG: lipase family protein [Planctomycetota bacterium]|jgi:hypothetical protein